MGILVENTSGLLGLTEWRARVEAILNSLVSYQWEMMVTSPHSHAGVGVKRKRVYYYAWRTLQHTCSSSCTCPQPAFWGGAEACPSII